MSRDDDEYASKSETEIIEDYDNMVKCKEKILEEIELEKAKLKQLEEDYKKMKSQRICVRVAMTKEMVEAATADCLKDFNSKNTPTSNIYTKIKSSIIRLKS